MSKLSKETRARLLEQRAKVDALVEQEFADVRDHVLGRLNASGNADLIDCPIAEQVIRRLHREWALSLPDNWEKRMPRYVRDASQQNAWAREASAPTFEFGVGQLRPLARLLVQVRLARSARRSVR